MSLPTIGFGCSPYRSGGIVSLAAAVRTALRVGYRMFDLAEMYGNERELGEVFREAAAPPREQLFLVGKVWRTNHDPEHLVRACEASLERLGTSYLDLYLLHSPEPLPHAGPLHDRHTLGEEEFARRLFPPADPAAPRPGLRESWGALRQLRERGLVRRIGVSNFERSHLEELAEPPPFANEIGRDPLAPRRELVEGCRRLSIHVLAHSPLSRPHLLSHPAIARLADRRGATPAQVVLSWNLRRGVTPLPSSTDPGHIVENLRSLELDLGEADLEALDRLDSDR